MTWYIGDWKITYYIEHLLMASLFGFKRILGVDRSSRLEVFCKNGVLKNFAKFTGKNLYGSLFFDKVVACKSATLTKEDPINLFSCEFCEVFKEHLFYRTSVNGCFCANWKHFWFRQKIFYFPFFQQSWNFTFLNNSEVDIMKPNEAYIALKPSIAPSSSVET